MSETIPGGPVRERVHPMTRDEALNMLDNDKTSGDQLFRADMAYLLIHGYIQGGKTDRGRVIWRVTPSGTGWLKTQEARQRLASLMRGIEAKTL